MKRGDIILFRYNFEPIAWYIRIMCRSKWNHVGMALNETIILDLRATKKRTTHIKRFKNKKIYRLKVLRVKNLTREAQEHTIDMINAQPKVRIWRKMLIKFFLMFFGIPSNICYSCTEIIVKPLKEKGFDLCPKKDVRLVTPEDINRSPLVEVIEENLNVEELLKKEE